MPKSKSSLPQHIAIICDGNRTWARQRNLPQGEGHRRAMKRIEELIEAGIEQQIPFLTFWIFSTENWQRSKQEVSLLFNLFRQAFKKLETKMNDRGVKLNFIGDLVRLPQDIQQQIQRCQSKTSQNSNITVTFAISYGGRDELIRAIKKYVKLKQPSTASVEQLTPEEFSQYLDTYNLPDPDLIVRTGNNQRLSGFLLWQLNYAELYFPKIGFPDFDAQELTYAIDVFTQRQRRFGK